MLHLEVPQSQDQYESVDPLFAPLDHQSIPDGAGGWTTEVIGIHRSERDIWIQLGINDATDESVLMHLSLWATADDALTALQEWSARDVSRRTRVIEVMRHM